MPREATLRRLAGAVVRHALPRMGGPPRIGLCARGPSPAPTPPPLPRAGLCGPPTPLSLAEPPVSSAAIPAIAYPSPYRIPVSSSLIFHRFASSSVHSSFSASPATSAAGSAAATPSELGGPNSLLRSLGLKPVPLFPGILPIQSGETAFAADSEEAADSTPRQVKRRRKQKLVDILWRRPAWGQGVRVAKRHWQEGSFYEVSRVHVSKNGRNASVWGIFHQAGVPVAAESRIGGANKTCWKAVGGKEEGEGDERGDGGAEDESPASGQAAAIHASV